MPKAKVWFVPVSEDETLASMAEKTTILAAAAFAEVVKAEHPCAVKQHFGERDNRGFIKPEITRAVCDYVASVGGQPFVTDTNTLYRGRRSQSVEHLAQARDNGFTFAALGAPVIIADGLLGTDQVTVPITGGKHFEEVRIASAGYHAASSLVVTHVKGHCELGLGGSIKNVGMGFAARAGKLAQHSTGRPEMDDAKCIACGACAKWCPADAIVLSPKARLLAERCIGCGECLTLCPAHAINFRWGASGPELIERICEHVLGFLSNKRGHCGYLNYVIDLTRNCDCVGKAQKIEYPDIGILASTDIVAVDKAAADISIDRIGKDIWADWWPDSNYAAQFACGEKIGLGTTDYELIAL